MHSTSLAKIDPSVADSRREQRLDESCDVAPDPLAAIVGCSAAMRRLRHQIRVVAATDASVLIHGESGTGKELVAQALHSLSPRRAARLVTVNCAAIPAGLLESEMFGHERGAFTGCAGQRIGRCELAQRGTLFLDEIGDIPIELQPKLLRVLQEHEFERVGSTRTIKTDFRLIAASHRRLDRMVADGSFRADLFYRLNVFPISVPPLRARRQDIPALVEHFVSLAALRLAKRIERIPEDVLSDLAGFDWPGNVRELQNWVERAVILSRDGVLRIPPRSWPMEPATSDGAAFTLEEVERRHILQVLRQTNWTVGGRSGAATRLGVPRTTLLSKMEKLGIVRPGAPILGATNPASPDRRASLSAGPEGCSR